MADDAQRKMGFQATWSMAVGGMIGGGIFSVLGTVVESAGALAWLAFLLAGAIALATGRSYAALVKKYEAPGGSFTFLRMVGRPQMAGSLAWILIAGYVLTISVYAFTFGHYMEAMLHLGAWFPRAAGAAVVVLLVFVNLRSVGESSGLEIFIVYGKLLVLAALAVWGIVTFTPAHLHYEHAAPGGVVGALTGAAAIFMAYEGFELLAFDYDEIRDPDKTLPRALLASIGSVIVIYIVVALGAASLVGAAALVKHKEIALAEAGQAAVGLAGTIAVSVAAAFSTMSAINATLFSTARLTARVAHGDELPPAANHRNRFGVPDWSVMVLGGAGAVLSATGSLDQLVYAASLAFLFTFATVNVLAALEVSRRRWISIAGAAGAAAAALALLWRMVHQARWSLALLGLLVVVAVLVRPRLLRWLGTPADTGEEEPAEGPAEDEQGAGRSPHG